jgi:hypothetical protein
MLGGSLNGPARDAKPESHFHAGVGGGRGVVLSAPARVSRRARPRWGPRGSSIRNVHCCPCFGQTCSQLVQCLDGQLRAGAGCFRELCKLARGQDFTFGGRPPGNVNRTRRIRAEGTLAACHGAAPGKGW